MTERSSAASGTASPATATPSKAWIYALVGTLAIGATLWGVSGKIPPQSLRSDAASAGAPVLAAAGIERSDRAEIEAIVHDYILNHPEIIPEAMERYQAKQMAKQIDAVRSDLETPFAGAWTGAAKGDVVLVEFADFACGFCRRSVADVERLLREDKNLKVVHRDLPILSEESVVAAKTALAAAKQGKYRDYYLAQFAGGPPSEASIKAAAAKAGLDSAALQKAFLNGDLQAEIEKNLGFARDLGFNGTPTFIIGDRVLQGAVGYDELKKAIEEARAKK
ncbi:DsbA family protein [Pseudonocardia sp. TMWB2A]